MFKQQKRVYICYVQLYTCICTYKNELNHKHQNLFVTSLLASKSIENLNKIKAPQHANLKAKFGLRAVSGQACSILSRTSYNEYLEL